jgi:hypothetical protein
LGAEFKTAPNNTKMVSLEREKSDIQYYVIRKWIGVKLGCA